MGGALYDLQHLHAWAPQGGDDGDDDGDGDDDDSRGGDDGNDDHDDNSDGDDDNDNDGDDDDDDGDDDNDSDGDDDDNDGDDDGNDDDDDWYLVVVCHLDCAFLMCVCVYQNRKVKMFYFIEIKMILSPRTKNLL